MSTDATNLNTLGSLRWVGVRYPTDGAPTLRITDRQTFVVNYEISDQYYRDVPESNLAETNYFGVNCLIWSELPNIDCTIIVNQQKFATS